MTDQERGTSAVITSDNEVFSLISDFDLETEEHYGFVVTVIINIDNTFSQGGQFTKSEPVELIQTDIPQYSGDSAQIPAAAAAPSPPPPCLLTLEKAHNLSTT